MMVLPANTFPNNFLDWTNAPNESFINKMYSTAQDLTIDLPSKQKSEDESRVVTCPNPKCGSKLYTQYMSDPIRIQVQEYSYTRGYNFYMYGCIACKQKWHVIKLPTNQKPVLNDEGEYVLVNPKQYMEEWQEHIVFDKQVPTEEAQPESASGEASHNEEAKPKHKACNCTIS